MAWGDNILFVRNFLPKPLSIGSPRVRESVFRNPEKFARVIRNPEKLSRGMQNPELWNLEYSSRNLDPTNRWNPESNYN